MANCPKPFIHICDNCGKRGHKTAECQAPKVDKGDKGDKSDKMEADSETTEQEAEANERD
jgi:hypothetical protein